MAAEWETGRMSHIRYQQNQIHARLRKNFPKIHQQAGNPDVF